MRGDVNITDERVGRFHRRDTGERQFLHQPVLQRLKHPLRSAARLGRIRRDMVHAQVREGPADLGGRLAINWTADLGVRK